MGAQEIKDNSLVFEVLLKVSTNPDANLLPVVENMHVEAVEELVRYAIFDIDDLKILEIKVKEK